MLLDRKQVSVVMTTFNGEKYVKEQLNSIINQLYLPTEIIICDDNSTDSTIDILTHFKEAHPKFTWNIVRNNKSLGFRENFYKAINLANGDYIFLSDQDDIWYENKIQDMVDILDSKKDINLLVTDFDFLICENGQPDRNASKQIDVYKPRKAQQYAKVKCTVSNFLNKRPGWTFAFRKEIVPLINKLRKNKKELYHDEIVWYAGLFSDGLYHLNKPMGQWRRFDFSITKIDGKESKRQHFLRLLPERRRRAAEYLLVAQSLQINKFKISSKDNKKFSVYFDIRYYFISLLNLLLQPLLKIR